MGGYIHAYFCGCEWTLDPGNKCPTHGQDRKDIRFECPQCGSIEVTNDQGGKIQKISRKTLCRTCQGRLKAQRSCERRRKERKNRKPVVKKTFLKPLKKEPITLSDCKWYLKRCLPAICKDLRAKCVDCSGCNRYEKEELRLEDYISCNTDILSDAANAFNITTKIRM